jgi:hypothetical protein
VVFNGRMEFEFRRFCHCCLFQIQVTVRVQKSIVWIHQFSSKFLQLKTRTKALDTNIFLSP